MRTPLCTPPLGNCDGACKENTLKIVANGTQRIAGDD